MLEEQEKQLEDLITSELVKSVSILESLEIIGSIARNEAKSKISSMSEEEKDAALEDLLNK